MIKLLDYGYLKLVETWGSDERIIESARMSTAKGFLGWGPKHNAQCPNGFGEAFGIGESCLECVDGVPGDEKLLRFLWENEHATPFEMAGITIEVKAPIMVFREWHRHRVPFGYNEMCLAGDTEITCIQRGGLTRHYTIEHIYKMRHEGVSDSMGRTRLLPSCQNRLLRVLDADSELYTTAPMSEVWQSGKQEIWLVETEKGHAIKASAKHPFYTREGWKRLEELRPGDRLAANGLVAAMERPYPPALRAGIGVWTSMMRSRLIEDVALCYVCGVEFAFDDLELDHVVPVTADLRRALDEQNLKPICCRCHKNKSATEQQHREGQTRLGLRWVDLKKRPVRVGEEMTYDIEVKGKHKNFVANGLVVHNSARYVPLPNENYLPEAQDLMDRSLVAATTKNRQAAGTGVVLNAADALEWLAMLADVYEQAERVYQWGLTHGVPKELARLPVPVGRYSAMRATANLRGWLGFMKLRVAKGAQKEIRVYAQALGDHIIAEKFPRTWALFSESK